MTDRIIVELDDVKQKEELNRWRFLLFKFGGPKKALLELLRNYNPQKETTDGDHS